MADESDIKGIDDSLDEARQRAEQILGYRFKDPELLSVSLTHASVADDRLESNERMEFLGDAILGAVVCEHLFHTFPTLLEGELTKIKSSVVSRRVCAELARAMGIQKSLILGKGMSNGQRLPSSLAAAVYEAVVAAIYLDGGYDAARTFILRDMADEIDEAGQSSHQQNFKSVLQQHAQKHLTELPSYRLLDEKGPDHNKCFEVAAEIGTDRYPSAWGNSKKASEQQAALNALKQMGVVIETADGEIELVDDELDTPETE